uniref:Uncharacterized protein n=1 Tax=Anguilla anguilla TaxID=7936 RepID=A0A0E9XSM3_ANGAN
MACYHFFFSGKFWSDYFHCSCHCDYLISHIVLAYHEFLLFYSFGLARRNIAMVQPDLCDQHQIQSSQYP